MENYRVRAIEWRATNSLMNETRTHRQTGYRSNSTWIKIREHGTVRTKRNNTHTHTHAWLRARECESAAAPVEMNCERKMSVSFEYLMKVILYKYQFQVFLVRFLFRIQKQAYYSLLLAFTISLRSYTALPDTNTVFLLFDVSIWAFTAFSDFFHVLSVFLSISSSLPLFPSIFPLLLHLLGSPFPINRFLVDCVLSAKKRAYTTVDCIEVSRISTQNLSHSHICKMLHNRTEIIWFEPKSI